MMTANYARLLTARWEAVDPARKGTYRYMWVFIYPAILKAMQAGEYKTVIGCELSDEVCRILADQKYTVISTVGKRLTEINWEQ